MAPIAKLMTKITHFIMWVLKCQATLELIEQNYVEALILISPNWDVEFHVHTYASLLFVNVMLTYNQI
jgi:hypothetical protein